MVRPVLLMRRAKALGGLAVLLASVVLNMAKVKVAHAQECSNPLVSTCINSDSFWPHAGPQRFAAVGHTDTVVDRQIAFGLVSTYLSRPVIVRVASPGPGGSDQFVIDDQVNANFLFAYGVTDHLQLDFAVPITLVQTGAGTSPLTGGRPIRDTAVRDARFGLAYRLLARSRKPAPDSDSDPDKGFAVTGRMTFSAPIGDNTDFAGERTLVFVPSLAADYRIGRAFFGADLGLRVRPTTEFAGARIGTQLTSALGAGFDILKDKKDFLALLLEGRAYYNFPEQHESQQSAFGITSRPNGTHIIPAEWMVGVRSAPFLAGDVSFFLGGGGPLPLSDAAITNPRFRFVLGVSYAPIGRDSDGDGVPDRIDRCPTVPGPKSGERPGCPASPSPSEQQPPQQPTTTTPAPAAPNPAPTETTPP